MNKVVANNIRRARESKPWTQRQLAEAAEVTERTVQRAEERGVIAAESLLAIAGALDVPVDDLRRDLDAEKFAAEAKKVTERYITVHLRRVESSDDLARHLGGDAQLFQCATSDDAAQDASAELEQELKDLGDIWSDLEPVQRRAAAKTAFGYVERLAALGLVVTAGSHESRVRSGTPGRYIRFQCMIFLVAPADQPKLYAMVEKSALGF